MSHLLLQMSRLLEQAAYACCAAPLSAAMLVASLLWWIQRRHSEKLFACAWRLVFWLFPATRPRMLCRLEPDRLRLVVLACSADAPVQPGDELPLTSSPDETGSVLTVSPGGPVQLSAVQLRGRFWLATLHAGSASPPPDSDHSGLLKYRVIIDSMLEPIVTTDERGRVEEWSNAACALFGYTREEMRGRDVHMLCDPTVAAQHQGYMDRYMRTGVATVIGTHGREVLGRRKDGSLIPLLLSLGAGVFNGRRFFVANFQDLRARKQWEMRLQVAKDDVERIIQTANAPIFMTDLDGRITSWNRKAEGLSGFEFGEVAGRLFTDLLEPMPVRVAALANAPATCVMQTLMLAARHGESTDKYACTLLRKDGRPLELLMSAAPRCDGAGKISGVVCVGQDVTDMRGAERTRSTFLAAVSHELRTPLNCLLGAVELALDGKGPPDADDEEPLETDNGIAGSGASAGGQSAGSSRHLSAAHVKLLRDGHCVGRLLLHLVNDVLDLCKAEMGQLDMAPSDFDLPAAVHHCADMLRPLARRKQLQVRVRLDERLPRWARADHRRLQQVAVNLLNNAVKFTDAGAVDLKVELLETGDYPAGDNGANGPLGKGWRVLFRVCDTGIGIPEADKKQLFSLFGKSKAEAHMVRNASGSGLGLAISKQICAAMNGEIGFESAVGGGSVFWFAVPLAPPVTPVPVDPLPPYALRSPPPPVHLPLEVGSNSSTPSARQHSGTLQPESSRGSPDTSAVRSALAGPEAETARASGGPRGSRVLLVDDNEFNAAVGFSILQRAGHSVTVASNGLQAVDIFSEAAKGATAFDVVLMDCEMPCLDGYAATAKLRALEADTRRLRTPVVGLTAFAMKGDRAKCIAAGMDDYATKPVSRDTFVKLVDRWSAVHDAARFWRAARDELGPADHGGAARVAFPRADAAPAALHQQQSLRETAGAACAQLQAAANGCLPAAAAVVEAYSLIGLARFAGRHDLLVIATALHALWLQSGANAASECAAMLQQFREVLNSCE